MAFSREKYLHLIGTKIGAWTILDVFPVQWSDAVRAMCKCRCSCGVERNVLWKLLQSGQSKSCGCLFFPKLKSQYPILYKKWKGMNSRCRVQYGVNKDRYYNRGINVCNEWLHNPKAFIEWSLSNGWSIGLELDRINNNKGYSPDNCRWVTHKENCRNKSNNRLLTYNGETRCVSAWAELLGIDRSIIRKSLAKGMDGEEVISRINKRLTVKSIGKS